MTIELTADEVRHIRLALLMRASELKAWDVRSPISDDERAEMQALNSVVEKLNA